jgi:hypothetical protein
VGLGRAGRRGEPAPNLRERRCKKKTPKTLALKTGKQGRRVSTDTDRDILTPHQFTSNKCIAIFRSKYAIKDNTSLAQAAGLSLRLHQGQDVSLTDGALAKRDSTLIHTNTAQRNQKLRQMKA